MRASCAAEVGQDDEDAAPVRLLLPSQGPPLCCQSQDVARRLEPSGCVAVLSPDLARGLPQPLLSQLLVLREWTRARQADAWPAAGAPPEETRSPLGPLPSPAVKRASGFPPAPAAAADSLFARGSRLTGGCSSPGAACGSSLKVRLTEQVSLRPVSRAMVLVLVGLSHGAPPNMSLSSMVEVREDRSAAGSLLDVPAWLLRENEGPAEELWLARLAGGGHVRGPMPLLDRSLSCWRGAGRGGLRTGAHQQGLPPLPLVCEGLRGVSVTVASPPPPPLQPSFDRGGTRKVGVS